MTETALIRKTRGGLERGPSASSPPPAVVAAPLVAARVGLAGRGCSHSARGWPGGKGEGKGELRGGSGNEEEAGKRGLAGPGVERGGKEGAPQPLFGLAQSTLLP